MTENVKKRIAEMCMDLDVIPGGMMSQLQVLDVAINKPFKDHLRKEYNEWNELETINLLH